MSRDVMAMNCTYSTTNICEFFDGSGDGGDDDGGSESDGRRAAGRA